MESIPLDGGTEYLLYFISRKPGIKVKLHALNFSPTNLEFQL